MVLTCLHMPEERSAFVLHFDSPSFTEWPGARLGLPAGRFKTENPRRDKFALRAKASMTELDEEDIITVQSGKAEANLPPLAMSAWTQGSLDECAKPVASCSLATVQNVVLRMQDGCKEEEFHPRITGASLEEEFQRLLFQVRGGHSL
ncbi:unnamed protein product [Symbiodinium sp. CCMP2456]|nr:unnamed protein product [Symbiodinium sp. CCMP2456]